MSRFDYMQYRNYRPASTFRKHCFYLVPQPILASYYLKGSRGKNELCFTDVIKRLFTFGIVRFTTSHPQYSETYSVHVAQAALVLQTSEADVRRELGDVGLVSSDSPGWLNSTLSIGSLYDGLATLFKQAFPQPYRHIPCIIYTVDFHTVANLKASQEPEIFELFVAVQNIIITVKRYGPPALFDAFTEQLPKSFPHMAFAIRHHLRLLQLQGSRRTVNNHKLIICYIVFIGPMAVTVAATVAPTVVAKM